MNERSGFARFRAEVKKHRAAYLMIAPFFLLFFTFTVAPVLLSLPIAFTDFDMVNTPHFVGLDNFFSLFVEDDIFILSIQNTIIFALLTGPIAFVACFLLAWLIHQLPRPLSTFFTFAFYAPALAGNIYAIWQMIFSGDSYGVVNSFLMQLGAINAPRGWLTDSRYIMISMVIIQMWMSLGVGFLALRAGLRGVPKERYEAAAIEGIQGRGQEMLYITIPAMGPQLLFAGVIQIASAFASGDIGRHLTDFPTTDYRAHTLVSHAFDYGNVRYEMGYAAAICLLMFLFMLFAMWGLRKLLGKYLD